MSSCLSNILDTELLGTKPWTPSLRVHLHSRFVVLGLSLTMILRTTRIPWKNAKYYTINYGLFNVGSKVAHFYILRFLMFMYGNDIAEVSILLLYTIVPYIIYPLGILTTFQGDDKFKNCLRNLRLD
jgi:hypothetical protein